VQIHSIVAPLDESLRDHRDRALLFWSVSMGHSVGLSKLPSTANQSNGRAKESATLRKKQKLIRKEEGGSRCALAAPVFNFGCRFR
jgi:hypothetical protein